MQILFQGDSITDGNRYKEPERRHDLNHQIGHSYAFIVSGMLGAEYPDAGLKFVNRGISGDTTRGLLRRWREDALDKFCYCTDFIQIWLRSGKDYALRLPWNLIHFSQLVKESLNFRRNLENVFYILVDFLFPLL